MSTSHLALTTRMKLAVLDGRIPWRFKACDVDRWRQAVDPRKRRGEPYTEDSATLLSNATVRDPDAPPTKNRNEKFLRRMKDENGKSVYQLDPEKTW